MLHQHQLRVLYMVAKGVALGRVSTILLFRTRRGELYHREEEEEEDLNLFYCIVPYRFRFI